MLKGFFVEGHVSWHRRDISLAWEMREIIDGMMDANQVRGADTACTRTSYLGKVSCMVAAAKQQLEDSLL